MKDAEDEAFDDLAKRQGSWGGGYQAKRKMAADKLWDKPSVAFDEWWNGDNDESTNPFRLESGAYWAWAGWKAALVQPAQEPVAWVWKDMRGQDIVSLFEPRFNSVHLYTAPPKREWVGLTDADIADCMEMSIQKTCRAIEAKLKEKNNGT